MKGREGDTVALEDSLPEEQSICVWIFGVSQEVVCFISFFLLSAGMANLNLGISIFDCGGFFNGLLETEVVGIVFVSSLGDPT